LESLVWPPPVIFPPFVGWGPQRGLKVTARAQLACQKGPPEQGWLPTGPENPGKRSRENPSFWGPGKNRVPPIFQIFPFPTRGLRIGRPGGFKNPRREPIKKRVPPNFFPGCETTGFPPDKNMGALGVGGAQKS